MKRKILLLFTMLVMVFAYTIAKADVSANNLSLRNVQIPLTGTVNHAYIASAEVKNLGSSNYAEGSLIAKLYFGETVMEEKPIPTLNASEIAFVSFNVAPHDAGTVNVKIAVEGADTTQAMATIVVAEESATTLKPVGAVTGTTNLVPSSLGYKNSDTEIIYKKDVIALEEGAAIKGITFKGYKNSKDHTISVDVWMENTTDTIPDGNSPRSTDEMTKVYSITDLTLPAVVGSDIAMEPIYDFDFSTNPFIYTGGNIRVVISCRSSDYATAKFEIDINQDYQAIYRRSDSPLTSSNKYSKTTAPVAYFLIDKEPSTLRGKVSANGAPIADARVKIVSGIVEYKGATDAEGKYSFPVYQDNLQYEMSVDKADFFKDIQTITFNGVSIVKDVTLEKMGSFKIYESNVPATGEVNTAYTATVKLTNGVAKDAGSYTAELFVDDHCVATVATPALVKGEERDFTFTYVPHAIGTFTAFFRFSYNGEYVQTAPVEFKIGAEHADKEVVVGNFSGFTELGPIRSFCNNSRSEIIYPKRLINLATGSKITGIRFYGYQKEKSAYSITLNAWMGNVDEGTKLHGLQGLNTEELTKVATDQLVDMNRIIPIDSPKTIIEISISEGFVYTGGDIRIYIDAQASDGVTSYFEIDDKVTNQAVLAASFKQLTETSTNVLLKLPVAHFLVDASKTLGGAVKNDSGVGIEGAHITLTSADDVVYYATSDAEGKFSMQVGKYEKAYKLTISHPDYDAYTHADSVTLADGDISDLAITLARTYTFSGIVTDNATGEAVTNANLALYNGKTKEDETTSDAGGHFKFELRKGGVYSLVASAYGFLDYSLDGIDLTKTDLIDFPIEMRKISTGVGSLTADGLHVYGATGAVVVESSAEAIVRIYNAAGAQLCSTKVAKGKTRIGGLTRGIYMVSGVKVMVK